MKYIYEKEEIQRIKAYIAGINRFNKDIENYTTGNRTPTDMYEIRLRCDGIQDSVDAILRTLE